MVKYQVAILLVEDNSYDAGMTIHALQKANLASKLVHANLDDFEVNPVLYRKFYATFFSGVLIPFYEPIVW